MADADFNFQQCSFLSGFFILLFVVSQASFYTQIKFSVKNTSIYQSFK